MTGVGRLGLLVAALLAGGPPSALADEVVLKNGNRLLGKAFREGSTVRIELDEGVVGVPVSLVEHIVSGMSPAELREQERHERLVWLDWHVDRVDPGDAQALYRIAEDASRQGFPADEVHSVLGLVLGADPDHAGARADLGEVLYDGRWVSREEARRLADLAHDRDMRERGFVLHHGEWLKPQEIDLRLLEQSWRRALDRVEADLGATREALRAAEQDVAALAADRDAAYAQVSFARAAEFEANAKEWSEHAAGLEAELSVVDQRIVMLEAWLEECGVVSALESP